MRKCQKRPIDMEKETYILGSKTYRYTSTPEVCISIYILISVNRDLLISVKRDLLISVKRDLLIWKKRPIS